MIKVFMFKAKSWSTWVVWRCSGLPGTACLQLFCCCCCTSSDLLHYQGTTRRNRYLD
ncbi:hypothetical protein E2C01_040438 [Portunus trituberculatus]|uniref:Uncharacterized protein n=1 Tax=Portunus trituberculatus TaxID=210409 RepID=A0A5B7FJQ4_PORTR|nr:hypothetical protein [Portunus trituberculatus]